VARASGLGPSCQIQLDPIRPSPPGVVTGGLALVGTTLTAYVYLWETVCRGAEQACRSDKVPHPLKRARMGAVVGAAFTALVLWFMIVASAATLGRGHQRVTSAQGAAQSLRTLAGSRGSAVFALGLVVSAVVALPVLMATTGHVVGAHLDWRRGLSERVTDARAFYGVMAGSLSLAVIVTLAKISVVGILVGPVSSAV